VYEVKFRNRRVICSECGLDVARKSPCQMTCGTIKCKRARMTRINLERKERSRVR
jgi:hypothetical protein